ncbi:NETI motif-containing protein [Texcoconibacillus texcoconensis]|uniref:DNA-binding PadR family transcriptional regulator n=1 Tax=Texcoconibacillus texcoconensis TaxID=1095777 RepID=A0A840QMH9_9BACI|nr:NETI motif-containing protein [Texcoconibacillus texcoconensis]MBB5172568.1 DNA-binding PadR family transcriptional regulator [Texcoconibacillus texcoconensis]
MAEKKKQKFYVQEGETIDACLDRMKKEGYLPVRRMEEPVYQEVKRNGKTEVEVVRQQIMFEGKRQQE